MLLHCATVASEAKYKATTDKERKGVPSLGLRRKGIPVIGVTATWGQTQDGIPVAMVLQSYLLALTAAGAAPVLIPPWLDEAKRRAMYRCLDGLLFAGGGDIAPERYGGENHPALQSVDAQRDLLEIALCRAAVRDGKPFLGICRGLQLLNVAQGGTLYVHLMDQRPGSVQHAYTSPPWPPNHPAHPVELSPSSLLARVVRERRLMVNSRHHQGIKEIGQGLLPCAWAPDGLVEAVEMAHHPFGLAVQWHPESLVHQPASRRLFRALVKACADHRQQ